MYQCSRKVPLFIGVLLVFTSIYSFHFLYQYRGSALHEEGIIYNPYPVENQDFHVYTPGCHIPKFDPFDATVKRFFVKTPYEFYCGAKRSVFQIYENGVVSIIEDELYKQHKIHSNEIDCYFHPIFRNMKSRKPDDTFIIGKKHEMIFDFPIEDDFIMVKCNASKITIVKELLALTPLKPSVEERCSKVEYNSENLREDLNIIIAGIDSVSKLNFLRYFNKTLHFLRHNLSAIELHGYTKVADNTYPNLIPFLTGHHRDHYKDKERRFKFYDDSEIIWKKYATLGYRTLYSEDAPKIGTFVLNRRGFNVPPTDYYIRPFSLALESSNFRHHSYCVGSKLETEVYFDYLKRFVSTMQDRLFFAFTFLARMTHDVLKLAGFADKPSFELLRDLDQSRILNKSVLVFFSDHGIRFGDIRQTYIGKIEERMPFMFLVFPDWFLNKYPVFAANLKINEHRLTTPYDIHATFLHLLELEKRQFFTLHGQSLLTEISPMRTCTDAMIMPHWCVCQTQKFVSNTDDKVKKAALSVIRKLNHFLMPFDNICVKLKLHTILDARMGKPNEDLVSRNKNDKMKLNFLDYLITVRVTPSDAVFEATVQVNNGNFKVADDISRINLYGNQSHCIQDSVIKKYCFCKDMLNIS